MILKLLQELIIIIITITLMKLASTILVLYSLTIIVFSVEFGIDYFSYDDLVFADYNITTLITTDIP